MVSKKPEDISPFCFARERECIRPNSISSVNTAGHFYCNDFAPLEKINAEHVSQHFDPHALALLLYLDARSCQPFSDRPGTLPSITISIPGLRASGARQLRPSTSRPPSGSGCNPTVRLAHELPAPIFALTQIKPRYIEQRSSCISLIIARGVIVPNAGRKPTQLPSPDQRSAAGQSRPPPSYHFLAVPSDSDYITVENAFLQFPAVWALRKRRSIITHSSLMGQLVNQQLERMNDDLAFFKSLFKSRLLHTRIRLPTPRSRLQCAHLTLLFAIRSGGNY